MKSLFCQLSVGLFAFLFACLVGVSEISAQELKKLLDHRLVSAEKVHALAFKGFLMQGKGYTFDSLMQAKASLLSARLDLCETKQKRIIVYEETLKDLTKLEKLVDEMPLAGTHEIELERVKLFQLEIQIAIEKLKNAK